MPLAYWQTSKRSLPTNVQREFRGVNRLDPLNINDQYASDISNMTTSDYPVIKTRPGYSLVGAALPARVTGMYPHKNTELHATSNGNWYRLVSGTWTSIGSGFNTTASWSFTNFQGGFSQINLIGANGIEARRWDGTSLSTISGFPSGGDYVETFQERVWCINTQNGVKNQLNYSEYRVATNWTTINEDDADPGYIVVEDPRGEPVNGLHAGNSHLTIFKPNSISELYGYTPQDFRIILVTSEVGIVSNQAYATAKGIQYFIHTTGLYRYSGGNLPDKSFSQPIQEYIDRITPSAAAKCCGGTDGTMIWFSLPVDGSNEPNIVIEYNTEYGTWSVWNGFSATHMTNINTQPYWGNVDGTVRQIGGTTDNGTAISGYWTTKVFGGQSYAQRLRWKRSWVVADVPTGSTLQVYMSDNPDRTNGYTLVQNVPNSNGLRPSRVIIPVSAAYNSNFISQRLSFTGPVTIKEWSREEESLPIY